MNTVRQPAVAGLFYPGNPRELASEVRKYLDAASSRPGSQPAFHCKALIVPHAGYVYSGSTAAIAYAALAADAERISRVVLLGPAHRVRLRGLAVADAELFRTPLGDVAIDTTAINQLLALPQVQIMGAAHWQEHSLEVQLPFLQSVLRSFTLVPLAVGDALPAEVAQVLETLWGGPETLIVISSDLSHYHDYSTAQYIDRGTCEAIEQLRFENIDYAQACGCVALKGLLRVARQRQMEVHTLHLCNSGDATGDRQRVVGYGSWALSEKPASVAAVRSA